MPNVEKLLRTAAQNKNVNERGIRTSGNGKNAQKYLDDLTEVGLLVPGQSLRAKVNVKVADRAIIQQMSKLSRQFNDLIGDFRKIKNVDNIYILLKIYDKCDWKAKYVKDNKDIKDSLWRYGVYPGDTQGVERFFRNAALGRPFNNNENILPSGTYEEWDATMLRTKDGRRDAERFVLCKSNRRVFYTGEHYRSFLRLK